MSPLALHPLSTRRATTRRGFTLAELLVVMGIIGLVLAGLGMALRDPSGTAGLASGQRTVASLLTSTRGQAILHQTNARLLIANDPSDPERYLRFLIIVRETPSNSGQWEATNEGVYLPRGVYFVPWESTADEVFSRWSENGLGPNRSIYRSSANQSEGSSVKNLPLPNALPQSEGSGPAWAYFQFGDNGRVRGSGQPDPVDHRIILSNGRPSGAGAPVLENEQNIRGILIRRVGSFTLFNEPLLANGN